MHFFSPVQKMPLLEVIVTQRTSDATLATAVAFGKKLGKTVIVVNDAPGFYANRILAPYMNEAGLLLDEGVAIDAIDRALRGLRLSGGAAHAARRGGPRHRGEVGRDHAGGVRRPHGAGGVARARDRVGAHRPQGREGLLPLRATGRKKGVDESVYALFPAAGSDSGSAPGDIVERCVLAMVNEAARCLEEGILRSPRDGDVGAVFGIGFPPFRGGPFRYLDTLGIPTVIRALEVLDGRFTPRFRPAPLLRQMAASGARFYPDRSRPR